MHKNTCNLHQKKLVAMMKFFRKKFRTSLKTASRAPIAVSILLLRKHGTIPVDDAIKHLNIKTIELPLIHACKLFKLYFY